jgi:hypothetical protein
MQAEMGRSQSVPVFIWRIIPEAFFHLVFRPDGRQRLDQGIAAICGDLYRLVVRLDDAALSHQEA